MATKGYYAIYNKSGAIDYLLMNETHGWYMTFEYTSNIKRDVEEFFNGREGWFLGSDEKKAVFLCDPLLLIWSELECL